MKKSSTIKLSLLLGTVFFGSLAINPDALASTNLKFKGDWKSLKFDQADPQDSYCALSRPYDQNIVLTFGKNLAHEYSMALDFQKAKLDTNKAYDVTFEPSNGQGRAYEIMPASPRAFVIKLGGKDNFFGSLAQSNKLNVTVGEEAYSFDVAGISSGQSKLNKCVTSLKGFDADDKKSIDAGFAAQKVTGAPAPVIQARLSDLDTSFNEEITLPPVAAVTNAERDKEINISRVSSTAIKAPEKKVVKEKPKPKPKETAKKVVKEVARVVEPVKAIPPKAVTKVPEVIAKAPAAIPAPEPIVIKRETIKSAQKPKEVVVKEPVVSKAEPKLAKVKPVAPKVDKLPEPIDLKKQKMVEKPAVTAETKPLNAQLNDAKEDLVAMKKQQAEDKARREAESKKVDLAKDRKEQEDRQALNERIAQLEAENRKFYEDAKQARSEVDNAIIETGTQALQKIRHVEQELQAAKLDNIKLSKELEETNKVKENALMAAADGNPEIEKTIARNNEAQRELQRMSKKMEQERSTWRQERQELEGMLFDPAVAEKKQREKLLQLETKLQETEKRLKDVQEYSDIGARERILVDKSKDVKVASRSTSAPQAIIPKTPRSAVSKAETSPRAPLAPVQRIQTPVNNSAPVELPAVLSAAPKPAAIPAPIQRQARIQAPRVQGGLSQGNIKQLLARAGVPLNGAIIKTGDNQYRWDASSLIGKATVANVNKVGGLKTFAAQFIAKSKKDCGGDFAALPSAPNRYEIACIGGVYNSSSSLVFHQKGQELIAITHETSSEDMDIAMDVGDKIAKNLSAL